MDIMVQVKDVYGKPLIYPVCDKAIAFAAIANQKTLSQATLWQIKALGYSVINIAREF